jgi:hypothetical protein
MPDKTLIAMVCGVTALLISYAIADGPDLSHNGNCEQVAEGKPSGWDIYAKVEEWGSLQEGYQGKGVYFIPRDFVPWKEGKNKGRMYTSSALCQGSGNGFTGPNAIAHVPNPGDKYYKFPAGGVAYRVSFWFKSDCSSVRMYLRGWRTDEALAGDRIDGSGGIRSMPRAAEWTHYETTVTPGLGTKKFCIMFLVDGFEDEGLQLGPVYIDEVRIERVSALSADDLQQIEIPANPAIYVGEKPLEDVIAAYRAGDGAAVSQVNAALTAADGWAAKSDEWYRQFFANFEPRGHYTITCPIHPFQTRFYMDFEWSLEEPWKLVCKHCKAEGRKYYYYPNPDYPDDGEGCAPTDEQWSRTHDAAWSKAHRNIPHDHFDGQTHGDCDGRRFYFLGKYYVLALERLEGNITSSLGLGYHYAKRLFPEDSDEYKRAAVYAHKAQLILLFSARAHYGDDYLAAAEEMSADEFQKRIEGFCRRSDGEPWRYEKLVGFRPFSGTRDITLGDPVYDDVTKQRPRGYKFFDGSWARLAGMARYIFESFCLTRASFAPEDDDIRRMCQRVVVSLPDDKERVAMGQDPPAHYLKRGIFEMEIHPFNLETGWDNQAASTQSPRLRAGQMLRDDAIIENVARDISYFWHNFFTSDGLGIEGSPSYTHCAYGIIGVMQKLYGMKGDFDEDAVYYDKDLGGLNPFKIPDFTESVTKMLYYATAEDDHYIPWEDSSYQFKRSVAQARLVEQYGGGIPEKERKYFIIGRAEDGGVSLEFDRSVPLPPRLVNDRRKAILRAGRTEQQTVVSLDFTKKCGHYQPAAQNLMVHACGQELASLQGYLSSGHFLTTRWLKSFPSHNCVALRQADGNAVRTGELRGDIRRNFIVSPVCQIVDSAEYDAGDWQRFGRQKNGEFSRQIILMAPSEEHQYVIDISRALGGVTHDYYLHCHGLGFDTNGITLKPLANPETDLYEHSGFSFSCPDDFGAKNINELAEATSSGPWQATWSRIDDYRDQPPLKPIIHEDVFMRLWMADDAGSTVIVGDAPAQRYPRNEDLGRRMKVLCVRRMASEEIDKFIGVIEPYERDPFISNVRRLELDTDDDYVVALAVETLHGTDYIISYGGPGDPPEIALRDGGHSIATDADFAMARFPNDGRPDLLLAGGSYLRADQGELRLKGPAQFSGRLVDFDDLGDTLTIESEASFPVGAQLAGQPVIIQHREDRSTFTIASVETQGAGRYLMRLDDQPHLMNNWLLVRSVDGNGITIEPPPVLDQKRSTYKVYTGGRGAAPSGEPLELLGALRSMGSTDISDEWGTSINRFYRIETDDYTGVKVGDDIGLTRLEKGHDTVFVTNFAYSIGEKR